MDDKYLSGLSERLAEPYRLFAGYIEFEMPLLVSGKDKKGNQIDVARIPASVATILERRVNAPLEVRQTWQTLAFYTGDASVAGVEGDHLIVLDAQQLREYTSQSKLHNGALVLRDNVWDELKSRADSRDDSVFYLSRSEVDEIKDKRYVKQAGIWRAQTKALAKVWDILGRGQDLTAYLNLAEQQNRGVYHPSFLGIRLNDTTTEGRSTLRPFEVDHYHFVGARDLDVKKGYGPQEKRYLVGIAPNFLEQSVINAVQQGKSFVYNGTAYAPQPISQPSAEQYDDVALQALIKNEDPYATVRATELENAEAYHHVSRQGAP